MIVQIPCSNNDFSLSSTYDTIVLTHIDYERPLPTASSKRAVQICGQCTLQCSRKHGADRLGHVVKTHAQCHLMRKIPLTKSDCLSIFLGE